MKILLKLLFVSSTIIPVALNDNIIDETIKVKEQNNQFHEYKDEVHNNINFAYPDLYEKNYDEYKSEKNNYYVKKDFNQFYSIQDLRMEQYEKYFENSKMVFDFNSSVKRWASGSLSPDYANSNYITENEFQLSLKERQKFIEIENSYSYQNYNTDSFIQVFTKMKIERIKENNKWGLKFSGSIAQEIIVDPVNSWKEKMGDVASILSKTEGLNLSNIKIEFNTKENEFINSDSQLPLLEIDSDINTTNPKAIIAKAINQNELFKSKVGLDPKKKYSVVNISAKALYSDFKNNDVARINVENGKKQFSFLTRLSIHKRERIKHLNFERTTNDLDHFNEQVYQISKNYFDIKEGTFKFFKNSTINQEGLKNFKTDKLDATFEYTYKNSMGQQNRIEATSLHLPVYKEKGKRQTWKDVNFKFLSNFKNDSKLKYINEDNQYYDPLEPNDISLSDENIELKKGDKKIIYFNNYKNFLDLYFQTPPEIKLTRLSENKLLIEALEVWSGVIEIDAINANQKFVLKVNIENDTILDFVIPNLIEVKKGITEEVKFDYLDPKDNIAIINKNSKLEVKLENNILKIRSNSIDDQKFIIYSNKTKKQKEITVKTLINFVEPKFENNFEVFTTNSSNTFEFRNAQLIDFSKIEYHSETLSLDLVNDKFQFYYPTPGTYKINFKYFNYNFTHEIIMLDNLIYKETVVKLDKNNHFEYPLDDNRIYNSSSGIDFEIKNNLIQGNVIDENEVLTLYQDGQLNKIKFIQKQDSLDSTNNNDHKSHLKWLIPIILIPVVLSVSGFIYVYLKRKK